MRCSFRRGSGIIFTAVSLVALAHGAANPDPTPKTDDRIFLPSPALRQAAVFHQEPEYPAAARQFRLSGEVIIELTVGVDGKVENVAITKGYPILNDAVVRAVKKWSFSPYLVDGHARRLKSTLSFNFQL
jgi:TonB family protein